MAAIDSKPAYATSTRAYWTSKPVYAGFVVEYAGFVFAYTRFAVEYTRFAVAYAGVLGPRQDFGHVAFKYGGIHDRRGHLVHRLARPRSETSRTALAHAHLSGTGPEELRVLTATPWRLRALAALSFGSM